MEVKHNGKIITVGRPRLYAEVMHKFSANMTPKHIELAKFIGRGNCSKGVRLALLSCREIEYIRTEWTSYFNSVLFFNPGFRSGEYVDRRISIRITISDEIKAIALEFGGFIFEGIHRSLELYGSNGGIDLDLAQELTIIKRDLYKKYDV